jgi:hypothetical protein
MKKTTLAIVSLIVIVMLFAIVWFGRSSKTQETTTSQITTFPNAISQPTQTNGSLIIIKGYDSAPIQTKDFISDSDAVEDPVNPGYYYLGYQTFGDMAKENPPYLIAFITDTHYFNILLLKEPLGESRKAVEKYLIEKLGISLEQMCNLNYSVGTPTSVNSVYASMNLGFSFCPKAVQLP